MKQGAGKAKGSAWERQISKILTKWLTGQDKEMYYYRSPGSGAVSTINLGNKSISGDIIALKPEAVFFVNYFNIECKNGYLNASIENILKENKNDQLLKFWEQACNDAIKNEKEPLLIFKKKGYKHPWVGISENSWNKFQFQLKCKYIKMDYLTIQPIYFLTLDNFLNNLDKNKF